MTGGPPVRPTLATVRAVLGAARRLGGPFGATVELCVTSLCLPWEALAIDLADVDWANGSVPVPARGGGKRMLHLPPAPLRTLAAIATDDATRGQAVTGGHGRPLSRADVRLDRLKDRLVRADGRLAEAGDWNLHGVRAAAAAELLSRGSAATDIAAALGTAVAGPAVDRLGGTRTGRAEFGRAVPTIGRWNAILSEGAEG